MEIVGLQGKTAEQLEDELRNGGKFVIYEYCISILVMTFKRPSSVHYIPPGQSALVAGLFYSLISLLLGWWGIPWGLIYTPAALFTNFSGGRDVTHEVLSAIGTNRSLAGYR